MLEEDLSGDVKKLKGARREYRLRVGVFRSLQTIGAGRKFKRPSEAFRSPRLFETGAG